jgi:hypothetical protein
MRPTSALLLSTFLLAGQSSATTCARIVPESLATASPQDVERHFVREDFARSAVVVEVNVVSIREHKGFRIAKVAPHTFWKTDGQPIVDIFMPKGPCSPGIEAVVGGRYLYFAVRARGLLASAHTTPVTLQLVGALTLAAESTNADSDELRRYLSTLARTQVRAPP